jgi:aminocarboxymuconate-semialdehyde decarboxylase
LEISAALAANFPNRNRNQEDAMANRRQFLQGVMGAAGACLLGSDLIEAMPQAQLPTPPKHKPVMVGGKKIKTVDVHCHTYIPEATNFLKGTPLERNAGGGGTGPYRLDALDAARLGIMDKEGIDVEAISINPFWYKADRDLATRLIDFQNQKLVEMVKAAPAGRFVAFGTVALQFPDLAAKQLEDAMKMGLKGAAIGGSVGDEDVSSTKYDPFWAKAEQLQAPLFMHPQDSAEATGVIKRTRGDFGLTNVIGNPLETTVFLSHMIFDGTLQRFPGLKLCCAHGGGYLPSYPDRMDHGCAVSAYGVHPAGNCKGMPASFTKKPTNYLRQTYVDSLVFTPEALRHLAAVMGPTHVMLGTDYPYPWTEAGVGTMGPVDHVFATPGLSDADRVAILGGNACKWLGIPLAS